MNNFSDKPIAHSSEDLLNRKQLISVVSNHLLSPSCKDGLVISINGKWGSGKTSIVNMIKENIQDRRYDNNDEVIPVVVDYSPWNITSQDQTIRQFLTTLSDRFLYKRVLRILKRTLNIVDGVSTFIPSKAIRGAVKSISKAMKEYTNTFLNNPSELDLFKEEVEKHLLKTSLRYIVFIDDLDRLNKNEIILLIQLMKSICNFSNITYVLLYDKEIVANAVSEQQSVNGYAYLEKIVQAEYNVPNIRHDLIENLLSNDLEKLFDGKNTDEDNKRISEFFSFGLFRQLTTIREEKRFLNSFRYVFEIFYKEIDLADLLTITYLRFVDERLFKLIIENQEAVLGTKHFIDYNTADKEKSDFYNQIEENTNFDDSKSEFLLSHLFPYMFSSIPEDSGALYRKGKLCVPRIFHKYIQMDFDNDDVSLETINNVLNNNSADVLSSFSKQLNPGQGRHLLYVLNDFCKTLKDKRMFESVLTFLFRDFSSLQYSRPMFIVDKNYYIGSICYSAIKNLGIADAQQLFLDIVSKGDDVGALVCLADYIRYHEQDRRFDFSAIDEDTKRKLFKIIDDKVIDVLDKHIDLETYSFSSIVNHVLLDIPDRLKQLVTKKDSLWLVRFIARSALIGRSYSDDVHFYISYNFNVLNSVVKLDNLGIDALIEKAWNKKDKQRLIVFKMQLNNIKSKDKNITGYSIEEIREYCNQSEIVFEASDDYEK